MYAYLSASTYIVTCTCSSQRGTSCEPFEVPLTSEQSRVVLYPIKKGETLKVIAFAGTGKTTTLVQFAKRNSHLKMGYCVFNRSVRDNAANCVFKSCRNIECRTFHSLAYKHVGYLYLVKANGETKFANLTTYSVSNHIQRDNVPRLVGLNKKQSLYRFAKYVKGTLENFWASVDREITSEHIPRFYHYDVLRMDTTINNFADSEEAEHEQSQLSDEYYVQKVVKEAKKIWNKMMDLSDKSVLMSHDGYLKLFQLSGENFADCEYKHWDVVLIDETQDMSPATIDIVNKTAASCARIFVGDPNQQIYSFRGATNAFPMIEADRTFYLTRSFRFGPEIAYVNSLLLSTLKGVRRKTFIGTTDEGCVYGTRDFNQVTVIARTNLGLFEEMARVIRSPGGERRRLGFVGGLKSYKLGPLEGVYLLFQGNIAESKKRKHPYKHFNSFRELLQYADHSSDFQLQHEIRICQRYPDDLLQIIKKLRKQEVKDLYFADVIFTTAHKSKGLEFENVKLVDDFLPNVDLRLPLETLRLSADERNLLYVAASRAKCQLTLSPTCISVLQKSREYYVFPVVIQDAMSESLMVCSSNCAVCRSPFSDNCQQPQLKLFQPAIKQSTGVAVTSQRGNFFICRHCGFRSLPSFSFAF